MKEVVISKRALPPVKLTHRLSMSEVEHEVACYPYAKLLFGRVLATSITEEAGIFVSELGAGNFSFSIRAAKELTLHKRDALFIAANKENPNPKLSLSVLEGDAELLFHVKGKRKVKKAELWIEQLSATVRDIHLLDPELFNLAHIRFNATPLRRRVQLITRAV